MPYPRDEWNGTTVLPKDYAWDTVVRQNGEPVRWVLTISEAKYRGNRVGRDLVHIVNGALDHRVESMSMIRLYHTWARDNEADRSMLFYVDGLDDVKLNGSGWNSGDLTFTAWMTKPMQFNPEGDPIDPAERVDDENDRYANAGYDYTPEPVVDGGLTLPMKVDIWLRMNDDDNRIGEWIDKKVSGE